MTVNLLKSDNSVFKVCVSMDHFKKIVNNLSMYDDFFRFLKYIGYLTKWYISQKLIIVNSKVSLLKSSAIRKLS